MLKLVHKRHDVRRTISHEKLQLAKPLGMLKRFEQLAVYQDFPHGLVDHHFELGQILVRWSAEYKQPKAVQRQVNGVARIDTCAEHAPASFETFGTLDA